MKAQGFFVTGTDTGIGKTIVSTVLAVGLKAHYWKPIQTGSADGTDSDFVGRWIGAEKVYPESYLFPEALSPHLAAKAHNEEIDMQRCLNDSLGLPQGTIIEGAGGVLVPINGSLMMIDVIHALGRAVVLVAGTKLGTINHTLLTLEALNTRKIPICGVITVGEENFSSERSIENYGQVPVLGNVSICSSFSESWFQEIYENLRFKKSSEQKI